MFRLELLPIRLSSPSMAFSGQAIILSGREFRSEMSDNEGCMIHGLSMKMEITIVIARSISRRNGQTARPGAFKR